MTHFPIRHIDDVLPFVSNRKDFVIADKGDYTVIDYVFAGEDTFDHPARLECRGIKFAPDGSVLARPLHKFFNAGERPDTQPNVLDFTQPHVVMDKLDGSMIHPAIVGGSGGKGEVVFMTRMGRTDVARKAERHLPEVRDWCEWVLHDGFTPIFEWTAPDNRIVVRYDDSELTLLAVRNTITGEYWRHDDLADTCLPHVRHHDPRHTAAADFIAYARAIQGAEGFVVRFDSGLWVKAKADDYVLKHRAKDSILQEKNILALVLNGGLDDVLPLLDAPDAEAARDYAAAVEAGIAETAGELERRVAANSNLPQKDFALTVAPTLPDALRPAAFQVRRGANSRDVIRARIAANCNSQSQVDANRALHGATWRYA